MYECIHAESYEISSVENSTLFRCDNYENYTIEMMAMTQEMWRTWPKQHEEVYEVAWN